jgi:hypothetical protein
MDVPSGLVAGAGFERAEAMSWSALISFGSWLLKKMLPIFVS